MFRQRLHARTREMQAMTTTTSVRLAAIAGLALALACLVPLTAPERAGAIELDQYCTGQGLSDADCLRYMCGELQNQEACGGDACPNLPGVTTVPAGYIVDGAGDCVLPPTPPAPAPSPPVPPDTSSAAAAQTPPAPPPPTAGIASSVDGEPIPAAMAQEKYEAVAEAVLGAAAPPAELPLTGDSVAWTALAGGLLLAAGVLLHLLPRRRARRAARSA